MQGRFYVNRLGVKSTTVIDSGRAAEPHGLVLTFTLTLGNSLGAEGAWAAI